MIRNNCAICSSNLVINFYEINNIPINLYCSDEYINKTDTLSFINCENCNTIQLNKLIPLDILYSNSHNYSSVGKIWNNYFELFINKIKNIIINKNILEIGCPSGKIAQQSIDYNKWFIIDPNKNSNINFNENIFFIQSLFDEKFNISEKIDIIIHSHLFEHIYEPNIFLKKCYEILDDNGEMIFGVPNMEHIAQKELCTFLGIFFEHTIFLNEENITYLLLQNNFIINQIIKYENHSVIYHVKKNIININNQNINNLNIDKCYYKIFNDSIIKYTEFVNNCIKIINENINKEVYIFSASYNTQYLLAFGLNNVYINGILDNCKDKHDKYLYGYNLKIYDPEVLKNNDAIVICNSGYYMNEIIEQIKNINTNIIIIC